MDNDRNQLIQYLTQTRNDLVSVLRGLSEAQLDFEPAPERWSIAAIVEHIARVENSAADKIIEQLETAGPIESGSAGVSDDAFLKRLVDRSNRFEAPLPLRPTNQPVRASLEEFLTARKRIIDFVEAAPHDFRRLSFEHRVFGRIDGHQRVLAVAGHCARHTIQINEVKADSSFPGSGRR